MSQSRFTTRQMATAGIIAAVYAALTLLLPILLPLAVIVGVILALRQRCRELKKGEIEDAVTKY